MFMSRRHGSLSLAALLGALGLVLGACGSDAGPEAESAGTGTQRRNDAGPGTIDMVDGAAVLGTTAKACTSNVDCGTGECNPATRTCACGGQAVAATRIPANLLIVLDRSCSMVDEVAPQVTKWQAAVSALSSLMTTYEQDIRFGLTLFPDTHGANCSQGPIPFPVGANANAMRNRLQQALNEQDNLFPKGPCVTNIDTGMIQAKMDLSLRDKKHPSHVVLVTDGIQSPDCDLGDRKSVV